MLHLDAESVFFAPKLYAILREGEKALRKTIVSIPKCKSTKNFKGAILLAIPQNSLCVFLFCFSFCAKCKIPKVTYIYQNIIPIPLRISSQRAHMHHTSDLKITIISSLFCNLRNNIECHKQLFADSVNKSNAQSLIPRPEDFAKGLIGGNF